MTLGQTVSCHHECVRGCFCKPGYVRGPNGKCINPSLCPAVCGKNEVFLQCGTACPASCRTLSNPRNLPCPNHCVKGCFCKEGFVRGPDGTCIPPTTCPSICGDKEEFKVCGTACPATCTNHTTPRPCPTLCVKGCFCLPGYVRGPEGKCILPQSCPVVQNTPGIHFLRGPSIASSHFESFHLNPQNDIPLISFSAMDTSKSPLVLESFPCFYSISSVSEGDFLSKAQNLMFARCSKTTLQNPMNEKFVLSEMIYS
ncbi:UNVERIFIED_CONTAM: von Willebrand factor [Trichonephila clavipes]